MRLEWFLGGEPLLFKSSFTPVYDHGFVGLAINKVYPDDFGEFRVRVTNQYGSAEMAG
jgi:titin